MKTFSNFISESYNELVADFNRVHDSYDITLANKKELNAKYDVGSNKAKDIEKKILELLRDERCKRTTFTNDDVTMFQRLDIPFGVYKKAVDFLSKESKAFLEYYKKYLWDTINTKFSAKKLEMVKSYKSLGRSKSYYFNGSECYLLDKYYVVSQYLEENSAEFKANKKNTEDILSKIINVLNVQMVEFKKYYLDQVKEYCTLEYKKAPKTIEGYTEKIKNIEEKIDELRESNRHNYYNTYEYSELKKSLDRLTRSKDKLKAMLKLYTTVDDYVKHCIDEAEKTFNSNVRAVAERIKEKNVDVDKMKISRIADDPKFFTMKVSDGKVNLFARSIIAAQMSTKMIPHFRFIITNRKDGKTDDERFEEIEND